MGASYLAPDGWRGVRIWLHDGLYRIQKKHLLRDGRPSWVSWTDKGKVQFFDTWQDARKYIKRQKVQAHQSSKLVGTGKQ